MTKAADDVVAERERQRTVEKFADWHDDRHTAGELASAAAVYAMPEGYRVETHEAGWTIGGLLWPWEPEWFKPTTRRRDLVKAGALILAEIERLDRAEDEA